MNPPVSEFQNINSSKKNINKAWRDRQGLIGGHSEWDDAIETLDHLGDLNQQLWLEDQG